MSDFKTEFSNTFKMTHGMDSVAAAGVYMYIPRTVTRWLVRRAKGDGFVPHWKRMLRSFTGMFVPGVKASQPAKIEKDGGESSDER